MRRLEVDADIRAGFIVRWSAYPSCTFYVHEVSRARGEMYGYAVLQVFHNPDEIACVPRIAHAPLIAITVLNNGAPKARGYRPRKIQVD